MTDTPRGRYLGDRRDYRVCCHHFATPTNRIVKPSSGRLFTYEEAERAAAEERAKGYMVAWVIGLDGLSAAAPAEQDHFEKCSGCGGYFDRRDLGAVFDHEGPLPHPASDRPQ